MIIIVTGGIGVLFILVWGFFYFFLTPGISKSNLEKLACHEYLTEETEYSYLTDSPWPEGTYRETGENYKIVILFPTSRNQNERNYAYNYLHDKVCDFRQNLNSAEKYQTLSAWCGPLGREPDESEPPYDCGFEIN